MNNQALEPFRLLLLTFRLDVSLFSGTLFPLGLLVLPDFPAFSAEVRAGASASRCLPPTLLAQDRLVTVIGSEQFAHGQLRSVAYE
ncbi:hypothetical protein [Streptomyces microflavus]|uniref:hypothetical protein n=1 Tax=Streptomyces microflavus TaxID=1919 RepID=UPI0036EBAC24